jgi:KDO2-lipid IV(A) lauroyltransferase
MVVFHRICAAIFARAAYVSFCLLRWKRATVYANLRHTGMAQDESCAGKLYRAILKNLARHAGELLFRFGTFKKLPAALTAYPCRVDGWDFEIAEGSDAALEKMRGGGIFLTAHYGNYEAIGPWLCRLGIPLTASYIPVRPAWLNRILDGRIRSVDGIPYGVDARTPREFVRLLDGGRLFCLLADQDSRIAGAIDGIFMGKPVRNNPLPDFLLRMRPGTAVFICWMDEPEPSRKVLHAVEIPATSVMDSFNARLEGRIRDNPALWYGFTHRRFMSREPSLYGKACGKNPESAG